MKTNYIKTGITYNNKRFKEVFKNYSEVIKPKKNMLIGSIWKTTTKVVGLEDDRKTVITESKRNS